MHNIEEPINQIHEWSTGVSRDLGVLITEVHNAKNLTVGGEAQAEAEKDLKATLSRFNQWRWGPPVIPNPLIPCHITALKLLQQDIHACEWELDMAPLLR